MLYFNVILLLPALACMVYAETKPLKGLILNHCKFFKKPHVSHLSITTPLPVKSTTPVKFIPVEIASTTESTLYPPVPLLSEIQYPPYNQVQYPSQNPILYPPHQEGAYPSEHEWQYSPQQEGPYLPQPEEQYPIQSEVQYSPHQEAVYPPQYESQRLTQQETQQPSQQGQQPLEQDEQKSTQQNGQQPPQQGGQQPPQQGGQQPPQQEAQYPPQQEVQYHAPYYQGYPYNYRPSEFAYIQPQVGPIQKSIGSFNTQQFPYNQRFYYIRQPYSYGYYSSPYYYLPPALNVPQVPIRGSIKST